MDARAREFRRQAAREGAGGVGKRYSARLRREAVEIAGSRPGDSQARIAADLGLHRVTLCRWLAVEATPRFRSVEVRDLEVSTVESLVLVTPQGFRVEGLGVESLVRVLRSLR